MISVSSLSMFWQKPDMEEERWEFFNHPDKQVWYKSNAVTWELIASRFDFGKLVPYPRSAFIGGVKVALSYHSYDDYRHFLAKAKRGYRKNYSSMEEVLQNSGSLTLKAPIVLCRNGEGLLFSGYRRLCLGWNYGMVPYVWLVELG